ncbi:MAG: flagellar hook-basal body complex protein FliE [bacterium]|nr:flagellar hook-basal body complex protein FliE [bacterium]
MSGFDLPPVTGYDKFFKPSPFGGPGDGPGARGPGGIDPFGGDLGGLGKAESGDAVEAGEKSFESSLSDSLGQLRSLQNDVDEKYKGLIMGEDVELHDVMIAANKSEVMFNLMLEVRNKLVEAWEKLSRSAV